jgi:hypothetical protein
LLIFQEWPNLTGKPGDSVPFLGRELVRKALVYEGKDKRVSYGYGDTTPWTDVVFHIVLEDFADDYEALDLPKDVQEEIDQVVSSSELITD